MGRGERKSWTFCQLAGVLLVLEEFKGAPRGQCTLSVTGTELVRGILRFQALIAKMEFSVGCYGENMFFNPTCHVLNSYDKICRTANCFSTFRSLGFNFFPKVINIVKVELN